MYNYIKRTFKLESKLLPNNITSILIISYNFVERTSESKEDRSKHGLYRSLINNMIEGVSKGWTKELELVGVGYRASNQGQKLDLALGFSHNIVISIAPEVKVETISDKGKNPKIKLTSHDKQLVGQVAATAVGIFSSLSKSVQADILKYKKNIILSNQNFANIITIMSCIFLSKIKIILFERNHISELDLKKGFFKNIKNNFIKILIKYLYKFSDLILGNSKELCEDLKKLCKCKIQLLYNFYDFKKMHLDSIKKLEKKINFKDNIILDQFEYQ